MGTIEPIQVLVVCSGNTCRSPMAAALLAEELSNRSVSVSVTSAGTDARPGEAAAGEAIAVMREVGIDLTPHRSRVIGAGDLDRADLILVLTREQEQMVASLRETTRRRVHVLGELARRSAEGPAEGATLPERLEDVAARRVAPESGAPDDIADPHGGSIELYRATMDRLGAAVAAIAGALAPPVPG